MLLTTTNNNLFDTFFSDPWFNDPWFDDRDVQKAQKKLYGHNGKRMMLTDIKESDKGYELEMDLPGFKKDEIKASLENGYLTITAEKCLEKDQKEEEGKSKKLSNHKRKLAMKRVGSASNAIFDKLGINSLSKKKKHKDRSFKPTSMSVGMAFGLSLRNLVSKKRRTFFTMFAGSIGIIGLGLVLSISNGFNVYVEKMEKEMLSV